MKLILKGGRVINPAEHFDEVADVLIEDGKIAAIGKDLAAEGAEVYDAAGKLVTPGLIDMHTHFREPGQEAKEDFESGSKAAAPAATRRSRRCRIRSRSSMRLTSCAASRSAPRTSPRSTSASSVQ